MLVRHRFGYYHATNMEDLLDTDLTTGAVFSVHVEPVLTQTTTGAYLVILVANEGSGKEYQIVLPNKPGNGNLAAQCELALMEINAYPTWRWSKCVIGEKGFHGQFRVGNQSTDHKAIRDSGAYDFKY